MKTLYLSDSSTNIVVDKDTDFVGTLPQEDRYEIRNIYYIEEPMHVVYQSGEVKEEINAKKGDILILFYNNRFNKYRLDTIKTKQWAANIKNRRKIEQIEKEEWARKNAECDSPCCGDCDACAEPKEEFNYFTKNEAPVAEAKESTVKKIKKAIKKVIKKG